MGMVTEFNVYLVIPLYDTSINTTLSLHFRVSWFQIHDNLGQTSSLESNGHCLVSGHLEDPKECYEVNPIHYILQTVV